VSAHSAPSPGSPAPRPRASDDATDGGSHGANADATASDATDAAAPDATTPGGYDAHAGGALRGVASALLIALYIVLYLLTLAPVVLLAPGWLARHNAWALHLWGRPILWLAGIRLDIHGAEQLQTDGPQLLLFTHQSIADMALLGALWPARGTVVYKREFHAIPLMGRSMRAMGLTPIDRGHRKSAMRALDELAARIREQNLQAMLAPEGTRSKRGGLLPFKRGPFHVALQTRAPIVPVILRGVHQVLPPGSCLPRSGTVRIDYLPAIDTSHWHEDDMAQHVREVRARFLELVPDSAETSSQASPNG